MSATYDIRSLAEFQRRLTNWPDRTVFYSPKFSRFTETFQVDTLWIFPKAFLEAMSRDIIVPQNMSKEEFKVQLALGTLNHIVHFTINKEYLGQRIQNDKLNMEK